MIERLPQFDDQEILRRRPAKNDVDPERPYAYLVEPEVASDGQVVDVATLFLTNRECPFRCLMCDLWKNTTDRVVPPGAIPRQIDYALQRLGPAQHLKLYNSGNFFDAQAIPRVDYRAIAQRAQVFEHLIVENHPRLCTDACSRFSRLLGGTSLEVALGLETAHPEVLAALNKRMTLDDFARAAEFLLDQDIAVRTFILLKPPFLTEPQGVEWALRSIEFALRLGVGCCAVIPTRAGNGAMDALELGERFAPPSLASLETVLEEGLRLAGDRGRILVDLWDLERLADCQNCLAARRDRLHMINLTQQWRPPVACACREDAG